MTYPIYVMKRKYWRNAQSSPARKAISPLIATLILIAIAISGGVLLYRIFYATAGTVSSDLHFTVVDASASQAAGFSVSARNDGTFAISNVTARASGGPTIQCQISSSQPVIPGQSFVCVGAGNPGISSGSQYTITLTATSVNPNGGQYATTVNLIATA